MAEPRALAAAWLPVGVAEGPDGPFETLVRLVVLGLVLFGGPLLRSIAGGFGGSSKSKGESSKGSESQARGARRAGDEARGKQLWKELLESFEEQHESTTGGAASPRPAPADPFVDPSEDPRRAERAAQAERERKRAPRRRLAAELPSGSTATEDALERGAEPVSRRRERSPLGSELPSGPTPSESELERIGGDRSSAPMGELSPLDAGPLVGALPEIEWASAATPTGPASTAGGSLTRDELRRAIWLSEVLGPPVSLRTDASLGPPGLRL
jgi:hypothetical protein